MEKPEKKLNVFEKYLTVWVVMCIGAGIILGKTLPQAAVILDSLSVYQVSIPIAVCLFFMMYPIMVKIDFSEVIKAGKAPKPVLMTLGINWAIKPFTMYLIASFFLGFIFREFRHRIDFINGSINADTGETLLADICQIFLINSLVFG